MKSIIQEDSLFSDQGPSNPSLWYIFPAFIKSSAKTLRHEFMWSILSSSMRMEVKEMKIKANHLLSDSLSFISYRKPSRTKSVFTLFWKSQWMAFSFTYYLATEEIRASWDTAESFQRTMVESCSSKIKYHTGIEGDSLFSLDFCL